MKKIIKFFSLGLFIFIVACSETPNEPMTNYSISNTNNIVLIRTDFQGDLWGNEIQYVRIESRDELVAYYENFKTDYDFSNAYLELPSFESLLDIYDETFFETQFLVMLVFEEPSGSYAHQITDLTVEDNELVVGLQRNVPEMGTTDMAGWHIVIEMSREAIDTFESVRAETTTVQQ